MEAKNVTKDAISKMTMEECTVAMAVKNLTAVQKQQLKTRMAGLSAPKEASQGAVETLQAGVASDATTGTTEGSSAPEEKAPEEKAPDAPEAPVEKIEKKKPGETTFTIPAFTIDTKGIRAGTKENPLARVTYTEKGTNKTCLGTVQRIFQFYDEAKYKHKGAPRQEAKILGDNGNRVYRFEEEINLFVPAPIEPVQAPEANKETEGTEAKA